jgi:hypothetical protein
MRIILHNGTCIWALCFGMTYTFQKSPPCLFLFGFALPEWSCQKTIDYPPFELLGLRTTKVENIAITMRTT